MHARTNRYDPRTGVLQMATIALFRGGKPIPDLERMSRPGPAERRTARQLPARHPGVFRLLTSTDVVRRIGRNDATDGGADVRRRAAADGIIQPRINANVNANQQQYSLRSVFAFIGV